MLLFNAFGTRLDKKSLCHTQFRSLSSKRINDITGDSFQKVLDVDISGGFLDTLFGCIWLDTGGFRLRGIRMTEMFDPLVCPVRKDNFGQRFRQSVFGQVHKV